MPARSQSQYELMKRVMNSKELSDKLHIPQEVAREYVESTNKKTLSKLPQHVGDAKK